MAQYRQPASKELIITYVKGEGSILKFWALPLNALETIKTFENHFASAASDLEQNDGFLSSNQTPVSFRGAVFSKIKRQWCRARVIQVLGFSEIVVQLIDYGNEENISVGDIRNLDDSFFRCPPQAVECILADVMPTYSTEWSPDAIRFCEQQLLYQTVSCFVVTTYLKVPIVRIAKKGENEPFVQRLINSGLAYIKPDHQSQHQPTPTPKHPPAVGYKMNKLDSNTSHLVRITYVDSSQKVFFVQLAAVEMEFRKLMDDIKAYTNSESLQLVNAPLANTPCLAQFSSKEHYRAVITSVVQGHCSVLFVDYGCTEFKDFQELRAIPSRFLTLQAQAIRCSLKLGDIESEECFKAVKYGLLNCHVLGHNGDAFVVRLTMHVQDPIIPRQLPRSASPPVMLYTRQTLNVNTPYEISVSYTNDVTEFYCQLTHFKDQLGAISARLNSGVEFEPLSLSDCIPNLPVCVKFSEDHIWYRAQVMKVNHEHDIEVFFVDFGNYDNSTLKDVRRMKPELMQFPVQAYKCCLFETESPSDSSQKDEMFDLFEELTTGQVLRAHVNAVAEGQCYSVILQEKNASVSINEKIQSKFSSVGCVGVSEIEQLYITCFETPDSFFAQFEKLSSSKLDEMQVEINEFYATARNTSFKPTIGSVVCAKYNVDGQFYRARVENANGMECEVLFIDYGNKETISMQDILPMNRKFMTNPQFGIECGLETFPPATPVEKLKSLMLENSLQAKMIKEQNRKWKIALTEDFAGNVAILEMLRQHETVVPRSIHGAGLRGFRESVSKRDDLSYPVSKDYNDSRSSSQSTQKFNSVQLQRNEDIIKNETLPTSTREENNDAKQYNQSFDVISIPSKAYRNVYVSHVVSPSEFYCQIEEESTKLLALMKNIEDAYQNTSNTEINLNEMTVDSPCCAIFEADGSWYRGQIREVGSETCSVYFIDYGNTDSVLTSKVKVLQRQFFNLPPQAVRCKSYNVSPKGGNWGESDIEAFTDMTLEKSFVAQFVESDGNGTYAVNLVSIGKLQEDVLNKEFVTLGHGRLENATKTIVLNSHAASSNLTFQQPTIQVGSHEAVIVTYGLNPGEVFCQLKTFERDFKKMMLDLQSYYNKVSAAEALIDRPHQGMICVAQFFQDSVWYRGEITKVDRNSLTVCYVDYGNCEIVDKKKIRSITQDFTCMPLQGIKCRLKGIRAPGKTWPSNQNISRYFEGDAQCHFIEKGKDCYVVDIFCNNKNVAQQLTKDGLAASDGPIDKQETIRELPLKIPQVKQPILKREGTFVSGQLLSVSVSYVDNPYKFWCQLIDEAENLEQLMADIEVQYLESENPSIDKASLSVGVYCMAKYSADEAWYRAQIKSCVSAVEYEVFFIDYGNSEVTSSKQLTSIHPEFLKLPPQCFECRLYRAPSNCDSSKMDEFQSLVNEAEEMTAKVEEIANNTYIVSLLYDKEADEVNISDILFGESSEVTSTLRTDIPKFLPPDVPLGSQEGYVTEVNTPHEFFIQLTGIEDDLAELSAQLSEECEADAASGGEKIVQSPSVGYACSAKYCEDNNWYRAEVIDLQETTADVLFVDYGNTNNVPRDSLKVLDGKFLSSPPYAIKCKLNGIAPTGEQWGNISIDSFRDTVIDNLLGITFISKDIPATVNLTKDDRDVAQGLIDMELASVDTCPETEEAYADDHLTTVEDQLHSLPSDLSYPKRKLGSPKLPVKICYIDSYDKFYCMPLELSTELDTVMKTLEILYSPPVEGSEKAVDDTSTSVPNVLEDPSVSMSCVAKYSEDEAWYRAVITDIEGDNICVTFVDYGNSEISSLANLRPLTPELIKIPPIAIECKLHAIQAIEGKEQDVTAKLEEYFVEEVELQMEVLQFKEPYGVKLYHDEDLADILCKEGLAIEVTPPSESLEQSIVEYINENVKENLKTAFVELSEETVLTVPLRSISFVDDMLVSVKFCEIENEMIVLYAVPMDLDDALTNLQVKLQTVYNGIDERVGSVDGIDFCAAKYSEDEMWYRAQILICNGDEIKVKFIDYGNSEMVNIANISKLLPEFMSDAEFSVKFNLSGYKVREDKHEELQEKMDEYLYNEPILVKLCKCSHNVPPTFVFDLICGETKIVEMYVNEKLLSHHFTVNPQLKDKFEATVESIVENVFYMLPVQFTEDHDKLQTQLQESCDISASVVEMDPGRLYAAKVNERWSRVSVSVVNSSAESALVKCVDYGLEVEVKLSKLVLLPEDLCHRPLLLQPCVIANFENAPTDIKNKKMEKIAACIYECEVLKPNLHYPLEIKLSEKDLNADVPKSDERDQTIVEKDFTDELNEEQNFADEISETGQDSNADVQKSDEKDQVTLKENLPDAAAVKLETNPDAELEVYFSDDTKDDIPFEHTDSTVDENQVLSENELVAANDWKANPDMELEEFQSGEKKEETIVEQSDLSNNTLNVNEKQMLPESEVLPSDAASEMEINPGMELEDFLSDEEAKNEIEIEETDSSLEKELQLADDLHSLDNALPIIVEETDLSVDPGQQLAQYVNSFGDVCAEVEGLDGKEKLEADEFSEEEYQSLEEFESGELKSNRIQGLAAPNENFETESNQTSGGEVEEDSERTDVTNNIHVEESYDGMHSDNSIDTRTQNVADSEMHEGVKLAQKMPIIENGIGDISKNTELSTGFGFSALGSISFELPSGDVAADIVNDLPDSDKKSSEVLSDMESPQIESHDPESEASNYYPESDVKPEDNARGVKKEVLISKQIDIKTIDDIMAIVNDPHANELSKLMIKSGLEDYCDATLSGEKESEFIEDVEDHHVESSKFESTMIADSLNVTEKEYECSENVEDHVESSKCESTMTVDSLNVTEKESECSENVEDYVESSKFEITMTVDPFNVTEKESECSENVEDHVESSKFESPIKDTTVEENEWDERPECDIKQDLEEGLEKLNKLDLGSVELQADSQTETSNTTSDKRDGDSCTIKGSPSDAFEADVEVNTTLNNDFGEKICRVQKDLQSPVLEDLIGTSWHQSCGRLEAEIADIDVEDGLLVLKITPSPEKLGFVLFNTFQDRYSEMESGLSVSSVSSLCAVCLEDGWYRAKILELKEDALTVSLIDNGRTETVHISAAKDLEVAHQAPQLSKQCTLASAYCLPEKAANTKDILYSFLKETKDNGKVISVELVEAGDPFKINLILDGNNILYKLISQSLVVQKLTNPKIESGRYLAKGAHLSSNSKHLELNTNLVSQFAHMQQLKDSMKRVYPLNEKVPVIESGIYAVPSNDVWLRGEAVVSDTGLLLRLVDTGGTVSATSELCPLLPEHCLHPPYTVPCPLSVEIPEGFESLEEIKNIFSTEEFLIDVEADSVSHTLTGSILDKNLIERIKNLTILRHSEETESNSNQKH